MDVNSVNNSNPVQVDSSPSPLSVRLKNLKDKQYQLDRFNLADGAPFLLMASQSNGTMKEPDWKSCLEVVGPAIMSTSTQIFLIKTAADIKNHGLNSGKVEGDLAILGLVAGAIFGISTYAASVNKDPLSVLPFIFTSSTPFRAFLKTHVLYWTPFGTVSLWREVWDKCGESGSGLGKKVAQPKPAPIPGSKYEGFDVDAVTKAAVATAWIAICGAVLFKIGGAIAGGIVAGPPGVVAGALLTP